jgi:hypothetical protein
MQAQPKTIWTEQDIRAVWDKGELVEKFNPDRWRKDACGAWISRQQHGNPASGFGWEIDRIAPVANGGADELSNLRPLQWKNAASNKNDGGLTCSVVAYGGGNV